jgi:hypothetical protein
MLLDMAAAIGEAHLVAASEIQGIGKAIDADRPEIGMVGGERPSDFFGLQRINRNPSPKLTITHKSVAVMSKA